MEWLVLPESWTEVEELVQEEEESQNSPGTSTDGWMNSTQRLL